MNVYSLSDSFWQEKMIEKQKTYFGLSPIKRSGEIADKKHRKKEISRSLKKPKFFEKNLKFLETLKKELKKWE